MGKLHKLRKVIEKNPERWYRKFYNGRKAVYGARKHRGQWAPMNSYYSESRWSYHRFIRKVLIDLNHYP